MRIVKKVIKHTLLFLVLLIVGTLVRVIGILFAL